MESALLESFIKLGSLGLLSVILWLIAKRFMDETVTQMGKRIDALEAATKVCEAHRQDLQNRIFEILSKFNPQN